jgi:hypothetical protein
VLACPKEADEAKQFQLRVSLCGKAIWLKHMMAQDDWAPDVLAYMTFPLVEDPIDQRSRAAQRRGQTPDRGRRHIPQ